jgi:hypothetical protein
MSRELTDFTNRLECYFIMPQIKPLSFWDLMKAVF